MADLGRTRGVLLPVRNLVAVGEHDDVVADQVIRDSFRLQLFVLGLQGFDLVEENLTNRAARE